MIIVALSGGLASAFCGQWALDNHAKDDVVLYFNDTKWEHPDLYRFLDDLSSYWDHPITHDTDGRTPEELFYKERALANNRMPFCSKILKAKRLQRYYKDGDTLVFGIGADEPHRGQRLVGAYQRVAAKSKRWPKLRFPLLEKCTNHSDMLHWLDGTGIELPVMYKMGFQHNNCSGGCVRAGKRQWAHLWRVMPEVYLERERVEEAVRSYLNKDVHFLKDETLRQLRTRISMQLELFPVYLSSTTEECVGVCNTYS